MSNGLELYKDFIDGLVERKDGVLGKWILGKGYPNTDDNKEINEFLSCLSEDQKRVLAQMVYKARLGGIHDTLAYVNYPWSKDRWACDYPVVRYKLLPLIRCGFRGVALMG